MGSNPTTRSNINNIVMTKKEKTKLAHECGYNYNYSGSTGTGTFTRMEGDVSNIIIDPEKQARFDEMVRAEEAKNK